VLSAVVYEPATDALGYFGAQRAAFNPRRESEEPQQKKQKGDVGAPGVKVGGDGGVQTVTVTRSDVMLPDVAVTVLADKTLELKDDQHERLAQASKPRRPILPIPPLPPCHIKLPQRGAPQPLSPFRPRSGRPPRLLLLE